MATHFPPPPRLFLFAACAALTLASTAAAQTLKVNGPLVPGGDVLDVELAGGRLIYLADQDRNDEFELYMVPSDASATPHRLNGDRPVGADRPKDYQNSFKVSPDGAWVVYRADEDLAGVFELYSVRADGSAAPVKLNAPLADERDVQLEPSFQITPDSRYVLYCAEQQQDNHVELFRAPIDGSGPGLVLNEPIAAGGSVMGFRLSPDARRVAIQIKRGGARGHALFVASADGTGTAIQLTPDENDLVILRSWTRFSPDGKRIVYGTYSSSASATRHLYSASILGILPPALLSGQVPYDVTGFEITADSSRVVYHRHGQQDALFSAPIDGRVPALRLHSGNLPADQWHLSPATGRVVFFELATAPFGDVISLPVDGSPAPIVLASSVASQFLTVAQGGPSVVFHDGHQVYGRAADGSTPLRFLSLPPRAGERLTFLAYAEDAGQVLYLSDHDTPYSFELYMVPPDAATPARKINGPLGVVGQVTFQSVSPVYALSPAADRVFYIADQDVLGVFELYARFLPRPHRGAR